MKILHSHKGYPEQRNFLGSKNISYVQKIDFFKIISHLCFKLFNKIPNWSLNLFYNPFIKSTETIHFFNGICLSNQRWVTTFETSLPRLGKAPNWLYKLAVKKMASDNCIKLIALSQCTFDINKARLKREFPKYADVIINKTTVIHPPQKIILEKEKEINENITFTLVGNQFWSKGGREVIAVFEKLHSENYKFQLNIISNLSTDSYASHTTEKDLIELNKNIPNLPKEFNFIGSLPNKEVLDILKKSDIALLPTYADTYGYFILEAQACGTPVISTDIRAIPEINNEDCGWIINVPKDDSGNGKLSTKEEREFFSSTIEKELYKICKNILEKPEIIIEKSVKSISRINSSHSPIHHAELLSNIYKNK